MFRKICKKILVGCICIGAGVVVSWSIFTSMAQEQANRESTALAQKINNTRVGQHVTLNGNGFLKTSQAKAMPR